MAYAMIDSVKVNPDIPIKTTLSRMINYRINPVKTNDFKYISSFACDKETAIDEFYGAIKAYEDNTLNIQNSSSDHIAYQMLQSFEPGEVTPELANALGYELAQKLFNEQHMFIVATHIDKEHIHNHIYACAVNLDENKKWKEIWKSSFYAQNLCNEITKKYGLSVIEKEVWEKYEKGMKYKEWEEEQKLSGSSFKGQIKQIINNSLIYVKSFSELCEDLQKQGVRVRNTEKGVSFMLDKQQRWVRGRTLGSNYTRESLIKSIAELNGKNTENENITVNIKKNFIFKENENFYYTRIPYTEYFIAYSKRDNRCNKDSGGSVSIELKPYGLYTLTNRSTQEQEQKTGLELYNLYKRKQKLEEEQLLHKKQSYELQKSKKIQIYYSQYSFTTLRSAKMNYITYIAYQNRKKAVVDAKEAFTVLNYMRSVDIKSYDDIVLKAAELNQNAASLEQRINELRNKQQLLQDIKTVIKSKDELYPIFERYNCLKTSKEKEYFKNLHSSELLKYDILNKKSAVVKSQNRDINFDKIDESTLAISDKVNELYAELNLVRRDLQNINKAKQIADDVLAKNKDKEKNALKSKNRIK